jgi:hypothetical protein
MQRQRFSAYVRNVSLLSLGAATAIMAILIGGRDVLASKNAAGDQGGRLAAVACVPEVESDNIFFISCGGIY